MRNLPLLQFLLKQLHKLTFKLLRNNILKILHYQVLLNRCETNRVVSKEKGFLNSYVRTCKGPAVDNAKFPTDAMANVGSRDVL